jgi:hypothetical protein
MLTSGSLFYSQNGLPFILSELSKFSTGAGNWETKTELGETYE